MKVLLTLLVLICATYPCIKAQPIDQTKCTEQERGVPCTAERSVSCGYFDESIRCIVGPCAEQFINRCDACNQSEVEYVIEGPCPVYPPVSVAQTTYTSCSQYSPTVCPTNLKVCGIYDRSVQCDDAFCTKTFENECDACSFSNIAYWVEGEC